MPRSKNPNPHQLSTAHVDELLISPEQQSFSPPHLDELECDEGLADQKLITGVVSKSVLSEKVKLETEDLNVFPTTILSDAKSSNQDHVADKCEELEPDNVKKSNGDVISRSENGECLRKETISTDEHSVGQFSHMTLKTGSIATKNKQTSATTHSKSKKSSWNSLGTHNPHVLAWFKERFALKEGKRMSASQVIKQYEKDFANTADFPLHNFQVGHYLRRVFPYIQRCKITNHGRRVGVYKHLCVVDRNDSETEKYKTATQEQSDLRRSTRVRRKKSYDSDFECSDATDKMSNRKIRNSGILYSLLFPSSRENPQHESAKCKAQGIISDVTSNAKKKLIQEELVFEWLREHYEYADGYHVRSLDVMRRYNRSRDAHVQNICQIGRFIKAVFPLAKHMRKTVKGGKREWIYNNIRAKEKPAEAQSDWVPPPIKEMSRPSLLPMGSFTSKPPTCTSHSPDKASNDVFSNIHLPILPSELSSIYLNENDTSKAQAEEKEAVSPSVSSPPDSPLVASMVQQTTGIEVKSTSSARKNPERRSHLESQINRLHSTKGTFRLATADGHMPIRVISLSDKSGVATNDCPQVSVLPKIGKLWSIKTDVPMSKIKGVSVVPNGWIARKRSRDGSNGDQPPRKISIIKVSSTNEETKLGDQKTLNTDEMPRNGKESPEDPFSPDVYQIHNERLLLKPRQESTTSTTFNPTDSLKWKDLEKYKTHWSGWASTPTRPSTHTTDYFEWVLFEDNLLCDGQRVFRELRIYDDWSVSIHVMGRKVYADEVGGITDLKRTRGSIDKVMQTLAQAKLCRGFASPRLSDMRVHGVIVAKPEIWSRRLDDNEELRHRAINCQVLFRTTDDCCCKCMRIIQLNKQKTSRVMRFTS